MSETKPPRRPFRMLIIAAVAVAIAAVAWFWLRPADVNALSPQLASILSAWKPANTGQLELQGNVEIREVNLSFKVSGRLDHLAVDEGDHVSAGQTLCSLDKAYFEDGLRQAMAQRDQAAAALAKLVAGNRPEDIAQSEAAVKVAEANQLNAQQNLDRAKSLLTSTYGTRQTYDTALAAQRVADAQLNSAQQALKVMKLGSRSEDVDAARAQLANADAAVTVAQRNLSDADLKAADDGTVLSRVQESGAIVSAGQTVFVLSLTSPIWVRTYVSEPDLTRVHPGQEASIVVDSPAAPPLKGKIGYISNTAEFTPKTVETRELRTALVYRLRIVAEDPKGVLRQGMPVTVTLAAPDAPGDLKVSGANP